ncbi:MAG: ketopantoate reductase family protein [Hyphomicrobiaceae bacterium]
MTKRIAVVGTGAVGGYIAAHLAAASHDVVAIDGWPEHVEAIRSDGLRIIGMASSESLQVRFPAMHITEVQGLSKGPEIDVAIVAVKSYDTIWATALVAPYLAPGGYVVSAQNGINEDRIASVVGWGRTVGCVVGNNFAVDLIDAGVVKRTMPRDLAINSLELGEVHGRATPRLRELADIMKCVDGCSITNNLWGVRWSKLCVNGMRNALSAVTGMSGNERDSHDAVRRISIQLGSEAVRVGQALGYQLESMARIPAATFALAPDDPKAMAEIEETLIRGTKASARSNDQRPSMAQDIQKGRRTEIDFLNGLIIAKGKDVQTPTPTHERIVQVVHHVERGQIEPRPENVLAWT